MPARLAPWAQLARKVIRDRKAPPGPKAPLVRKGPPAPKVKRALPAPLALPAHKVQQARRVKRRRAKPSATSSLIGPGMAFLSLGLSLMGPARLPLSPGAGF